MIRKLAFLLLIASFSGCNDINYDSETRLVVQGQLYDRYGEPIPNEMVDVAVFIGNEQSDWNQAPNAQDVISYANTDELGAFKLAIPAPKGDQNYLGIRINHHPGTYQQKEFLYIKVEDFVNYRFDLNKVTLYKNAAICQLNIFPQNTNANLELKNVSVEGLLADQFVYVNPPVISGLNLQRQVVKSQTVIIHYDVVDYSSGSAIITQNSVNVPIGLDNVVNYTLNY